MDLLPSLDAALLPLADESRAAAMRAYMRDHFEFLGIPTPARRAAARPLLKAMKGAGAAALLEAAGELWARPQREYHYTALDMLAMHWKPLGEEHLPQLISLARRKSWWDTVDGIAGIVGDVLRREHHGMDEALAHSDFWVRRIALLHQLGWRGDTDTERLFRYALALSHEKEFFIQKAIGWALRDYAHHDPEAVRRFLAGDGMILAPLSRREAAKHL
ncbi:DNA alkylation repair protein [Massilia endophytica]|uniref:DNA alkylation repair protein n=1 Tax=Massilia endophytica TaxID=2899220 RepID=UPI001E393EEF|nr:DNA alkylation repair protein [Massilia endophytica]UGQ48527.1 DNA alkylation repair protein [Massilia endophytica]